MKTLAALLVESGQPLVLAELEIPALKPGQALVEIAYSGACGTQAIEWKGHKGIDKWVPHCLGHEGTGTVLECGSAVSRVEPGDKVVLSWIRGGGIEAGGAQYRWNGKVVNAGGVTTFQKHAVVSENRLSLLPPGASLDTAILLGCAAPTGMGAVFNVTKIVPGESVAIFGTGGIGLNACMAAAFAGAMPILAIDPNPSRRALALAFGATHTIDPSEGDVLAAISTIVPRGVDAAIEATGLPSAMAQALHAVRQQGGRAVAIANARHGSLLTIDPAAFNQGKTLHGTWGGDSVPDRDYPRYGRLLASGRFDLKKFISAAYSLARANDALSDLVAGVVGRPVIDMRLD